MGKQDNRRDETKDYRGKMKDSFSYRTLLTTLMNQVKAIRSTKTNSSIPTLNILDVDIPTINLGLNNPEYEKYVGAMIQAYNRYLGYSSGITTSGIKQVFKYSLDLFCMMRLIFRYYEANEMKLPTGEELNGIFDLCTSTVIDGTGSHSVMTYTSSRIDSTLKGISNKVWESDFISKVETILLPAQVMEFYNYYLGSLFDVSDSSSKEQLTFARIWVSLEDQNFITLPSSGVFPKITKTQFDAVYSNLNSVLTPTVRDFICTFLGWVKPNFDWTRPITADRVYVNRDEKFLSTFNMLFPEKVDTIVQTGEDVDQVDVKDLANAWARYYYDFEILGSSETSDEFVATKYYFGIEDVNAEQYMLMQNEQLNDITVDFYNYPLAAVLASEEIAGSKGKYVGGIYSLMTRINAKSGSYILNHENLNQVYLGNDLKFNMYDFVYDVDAESAEALLASNYAGLVGDISEVCETSENLAIFNYPVVIPEVWNVLWKVVVQDGIQYFSNLVADVIVNGGFTTPWEPSSGTYSANYSHIINHDGDLIAFDTYTMDPNEVHLAIATTIFAYLTGFNSYNESIQYVDNLFRNKQQQTQ